MNSFKITPLKTALMLLFIVVLVSGCRKAEDPEIPLKVTDADGNVYDVVIIGKQGWMKENLKVIHYSDGSEIPNVTGTSEWASLTSGAWSEYNNSASTGTTYGKLYNGFAVETGKLCPTGWRVPTDDDWTELMNFLGGQSVAGGQIKQEGTSLWKTPNEGATNSSGFTALPAGFRGPTGLFYQNAEVAIWWSSSSEADKLPYWITVFSNAYMARNFPVTKVNGMTIRCIWAD